MYSKTVLVANPSGLHARPAAVFAKAAAEFEADVAVKKAGLDGAGKSAKSMLVIMSMAVKCGDTLEIAADGVDEVAAVDALVELVESGCGE